MRLKVTFGVDPTGFAKDITEKVIIPKDVCLYCCHDSRHNISRLHNEVKKALEYKGYDLEQWFTLLKVYTL